MMKYTINIIITASLICSCNNSSPRKVVKYYEDGKIRLEEWVKGDIVDGPSITYYHNGAVKGMAINKNGHLDSKLLTYYENGTLEFVGNMKNGKIKDGYIYRFYPNGKLTGKFYYINDTAVYIKNLMRMEIL